MVVNTIAIAKDRVRSVLANKFFHSGATNQDVMLNTSIVTTASSGANEHETLTLNLNTF